MSTAVLPTLAGLGINVTRTPMWDSQVQTSISGKEIRTAFWTYPKYKWEVMFSVLRSSGSYTELQQLFGFFNARQGQFDTFLYQDADDNSVTSQAIGTGDGSTTTFQLVRTFGSFVEPILAPNVVSHVYRAGVDHSDWTVSNWATATPGLITFNAAPANGQAITADFTYYFPVRMTTDTMAFDQKYTHLYAVKKFAFQSVKN